ncbi:MAG: hypothetical protein Q9217_005874, partial [Psora testacea]
NLRTDFQNLTEASINSLAALSKCIRLQTLDLSLVSEAIPHASLFHALSSLINLQTLYIPRAFAPSPEANTPEARPFGFKASASKIQAHRYELPPNLRVLQISGSLTDLSLLQFSTQPRKLTHLALQHCPRLSALSIYGFLCEVSPHLTTLQLGPNIPLLSQSASYDMNMFPPMPELKELSISFEFLKWRYFYHYPPAETSGNGEGGASARGIFPSLHTLQIDAQEDVYLRELDPLNIWTAVDTGVLPSLRVLKVHRRLGWQEEGVYGFHERWLDVRDLDDLLKALAAEDRQANEGCVDEEDAGVIFMGMR